MAFDVDLGFWSKYCTMFGSLSYSWDSDLTTLFDTNVLYNIDYVIVVFWYVSRSPVCTCFSDVYLSLIIPLSYGVFVCNLGLITGLR